jgi:hypothetical protein
LCTAKIVVSLMRDISRKSESIVKTESDLANI